MRTTLLYDQTCVSTGPIIFATVLSPQLADIIQAYAAVLTLGLIVVFIAEVFRDAIPPIKTYPILILFAIAAMVMIALARPFSPIVASALTWQALALTLLTFTELVATYWKGSAYNIPRWKSYLILVPLDALIVYLYWLLVR